MIRYTHIVVTVVFLLPFLITPSFAQYDDLKFEHITVADGLPDNSVWRILQDHLGFMWFGTANGLVKYDGYKMTIYQPDENDSSSIINADVNCIYEDKNYNLWIAHTKGISFFHRGTESFTNYLYDPNAEPFLKNWVFNIYQDHLGNIWVGTYDNGLIKMVIDSSSSKKLLYKINNHYLNKVQGSINIPSNSIFAIYEDKDKTLLIGSTKGISIYNSQLDQFVTHNVISDSTSSTGLNAVIQIFEDRQYNLWFSTSGDGEALGKFDKRTGEVEYISFEDVSTEFIMIDKEVHSPNFISAEVIINKDNTFWVPTVGGGIIHFNPITRNYKAFIHDPRDPKSLSFCHDNIYGIWKDYSGLLWVGTRDGGVNKSLDSGEIINHIQYDERNLNGLSDRIVSCIYEDEENNMWIGTLGSGLNKFDKELQTFSHYRNDKNYQATISDDFIECILDDGNGNLWIGTRYGGLNKFDKKTEKFISYQFSQGNESGIPDNYITSICKDTSDNIIIGTQTGTLSVLDIKTNEFQNYFKRDDTYLMSLSDDTLRAIWDIRIDPKGLVWFVSGDGDLHKFDISKETLKKYTFDDLTFYNKFSTFYEDKTGRIWIGRDTGGLIRFEKDNEKYKIYSKEDGLPDETIGAILEDDHGNLWLRTGTSICKYSPNDESFTVIITLNNYQKFNCRRAWKSKQTGEMYFPGDDGFYIFDPDDIKINLVTPKVVFTDFKVFDESVSFGKDSPLEKHINVAKQIILNHWQNDFSIEFAALHFVDQKRNQYKYMLNGYDDHWRVGDVNRLANYTNMSPGDYVFKVIVSNSDGIWNNEGASIKIIILPPWWATTWAYLIYGLIILSIIYFTWKLQLKRIRIKHEYEMSKFEAEKMHEVDEMKSRFFANISHEFRTPLTLIFGPAKDVLEKTQEPDTKKNVGLIKRNATRLYGLVNQLLDLSKLEAGKMKLEASKQDIIPLLKGIFLSFSSLAERRKITLKFNTLEQNLNLYIDRDKVEKIMNNLLSNAFKFTPEGGKIDFTVEKMVNDAEIRITDNGIGIPEKRIDKIFDRFYQVDGSHTRESEGTGIGLALTKELVELHKGKIKVESKEGEGTTVSVQLPLGKDHLKPDEIVEKVIKEDILKTGDEIELIKDIENRKEKTEIDALLETDKPLLLIVEDNSDVRSYIISHLEEDYRIQEAIDGEDGLNQAMNHIPDLIISDIMMPKMDGFELCNILKTDEKTSHIPIIMLTAKASSKDKMEGYETGADDYIMKPFDATELKVRIKNLIEIRRKLQEKFSSDDYGIPKELSSIDEQFMKRVLSVVNEHISEEEFSIEELGKEAAMSRMHLHRKLKALTGKSPSLFIRSVRLNKAMKFIKENRETISEIAYDLGFGSPSYFTKCFKEEFGYPPSELIK